MFRITKQKNEPNSLSIAFSFSYTRNTKQNVKCKIHTSKFHQFKKATNSTVDPQLTNLQMYKPRTPNFLHPTPYRSPNHHVHSYVYGFYGGQFSPLPVERPKAPPPKRNPSPLPLVKLTIPKLPILGPLTESQTRGEKELWICSSAQLTQLASIDSPSFIVVSTVDTYFCAHCSVVIVSPVISTGADWGGFADRARLRNSIASNLRIIVQVQDNWTFVYDRRAYMSI